MKHFWKKLGAEKDFSVIAIGDNVIRGARFHQRSKKWHLTAFYSVDADGDDKSGKLREVVRKVGSPDCSIVTGNAPESVFFRFASVELPEKAQRGAVELELPRHVIRVPDKYAFQFTVDPDADADGAVGVNVTLYPQQTLDEIAGLLTGSGCSADEFVFPFMAVSREMPRLYLPEIEKDFYFCDGKWMPVPSDQAAQEELIAEAEATVQESFVLPVDNEIDVREYLPLLMTAKVIADKGISAVSSRVLPEKVRPVRYRQHVVLAVMLLVLLLINLGWKFYRTHGKTIREYRKTVTATKQLKAKTAKIERNNKRDLKENKETARVVEMNSGNRETVQEFALLSEVLPKNVLVTSMRWNDNAVDLTLVCEDDTLDLSRLIQPLRRWKVEQQQQRRTGDSAVATINAKLVLLKDSGKGEK